MALKDIWTDKRNNVDDINAEDINNVARAVIDLEDDSEAKAETIESLSADLDDVKNQILGVEEEIQLINEGGIE